MKIVLLSLVWAICVSIYYPSVQAQINNGNVQQFSGNTSASSSWFAPDYQSGTCAKSTSSTPYVSFQTTFPSSGAREVAVMADVNFKQGVLVYIYSTSFSPASPCTNILGDSLGYQFSFVGGPVLDDLVYFEAGVVYTFAVTGKAGSPSGTFVINIFDYASTGQYNASSPTWNTPSAFTNQFQCSLNSPQAYSTYQWNQATSGYYDIYALFGSEGGNTYLQTMVIYLDAKNVSMIAGNPCNATVIGGSIIGAYAGEGTYIANVSLVAGHNYLVALSGGSSSSHWGVRVIPTRVRNLQSNPPFLLSPDSSCGGGATGAWDAYEFQAQNSIYLIDTAALSESYTDVYSYLYAGNNNQSPPSCTSSPLAQEDTGNVAPLLLSSANVGMNYTLVVTTFDGDQNPQFPFYYLFIFTGAVVNMTVPPVCGWGRNDVGQLGIGQSNSTVYGVTPIPFYSSNQLTQVYTSATFHFATTVDGKVYSCGQNNNAQLGNYNYVNKSEYSTPIPVDSTLSASWMYLLLANGGVAFDSASGNLYGWGFAAGFVVGKLTGVYPRIQHFSDRPMTASGNLTQVASTNGGLFITFADNSTWASGFSANGRLGVGNVTNEATFVQMTFWEEVPLQQIYSSQSAFVCATDVDSLLYCWGANSNGQLGLGNQEDMDTPQHVPFFDDYLIAQFKQGDSHALLLTCGGQLYAWGNNANGQLGIGSFTSQSTPQLVTALQNFNIVEIVAGAYHSYARTATNEWYVWGIGTALGLNNTNQADQNVPVINPYLAAQNITHISSSSEAVFAIGWYDPNAPTTLGCNLVNECVVYPNICQNLTCVDTQKSYKCVCPQGFTGPNCQETNHCVNATICGPNAFCTNTNRSYTCSCNPGFTRYGMNPLICINNTVMVNATSCGNGSLCATNAMCNSTGQNFTCVCPKGYTGNGLPTQYGGTGCSQCGNNVVEYGEQCDTTSPCCSKTCQFMSNTTVCRSGGVCDPAEYCMGNSASCPVNQLSPNGTSCTINNLCVLSAGCFAGNCTATSYVTPPSDATCQNGIFVCNSGTTGGCGDGICETTLNETCATCPSDCPCTSCSGVRCKNGTCVDSVSECLTAQCPVDTDFMCADGRCVADFNDCANPNCNQKTCWDGTCVSNVLACSPIPACPTLTKRCNGMCIESSETCVVTLCTRIGVGFSNCEDGSCSCVCPAYAGCPTNYLLCPSGLCASDIMDCQSNGNTTCTNGTFLCSDGTCNYPSDCVQPAWSVQPVAFTQQISPYLPANLSMTAPDGQNLGSLIIKAGTFGNFTVQLSVAPVSSDTLDSYSVPSAWNGTSIRDNLFSCVASFSLSVPVDSFQENVTIQFWVQIPPGKNKTDLCLAYINATNDWVCQSELEFTEDGYAIGITQHFTPFAVVSRVTTPIVNKLTKDDIKLFKDITANNTVVWVYVALIGIFTLAYVWSIRADSLHKKTISSPQNSTRSLNFGANEDDIEMDKKDDNAYPSVDYGDDWNTDPAPIQPARSRRVSLAAVRQTKEVKKFFNFGLKGKHKWLSIYYCARINTLTRTSRVTILLCMVLTNMAVSCLFYNAQNRSSKGEIVLVGFISSLISFTISFTIFILFGKSSKKYKPYVYIFAAIYCLGTTFLTFWYNLTFEADQSKNWCVSVAESIIQDAIINEPIKILLFAFLIGCCPCFPFFRGLIRDINTID